MSDKILFAELVDDLQALSLLFQRIRVTAKQQASDSDQALNNVHRILSIIEQRQAKGGTL